MSLLQICLIAGVATATLGIGAAVTINKIQAKTVAAEQVRKDSADVYARRQTIYASCVSEKLRRKQEEYQRKEDEYVVAMRGTSIGVMKRLFCVIASIGTLALLIWAGMKPTMQVDLAARRERDIERLADAVEAALDWRKLSLPGF